jgi:alkanesulfonate monooxygenase SsuD/methylene tetrahydromethanopterin reductase-like flavin-dependent oxidoreductase (luciferase family)
MRFALMTEPQQGMSYADQLASAKAAEANGFDVWFRSDHFASFPGAPGRPTTDAWTVLAGLARETQRIGLGVLVSPVTFRHPGVLAKVTITVDEMSGGRVEVGVGAGWNETEHRELGLAFPDIKGRADLLEDQLAILHGLWGESDGWNHDGITGVHVRDALFRPRPVEVPGRPATASGGVRPRIIVGGQGSPRSFRLAARYADEFNLSSSSPAKAAQIAADLDAACQAIGRDPATLARSTMAGVLVGRTEAEVKAREHALLESFGPDEFEDAEAWLEERRTRWVYGTPDEARAQLRRFADTGLERIMLQDFLPWDLDMVDVMGEELVGRA